MKTAIALALSLFTPASMAVTQEPEEHSTCRLHGRFVDERGAPLAGVELRLIGWPASDGRLRYFGTPQDWSDPAPVVSDGYGHFELRFAPPRAYQFALSAERAGYGDVAWRWLELVPGSSLDLGDVTLEQPGVIVGRLADRQGNPLAEGWRVSATQPIVPLGGRATAGSEVAIEPSTGTFRIDDLPPGSVYVSARRTDGWNVNGLWVRTSPERPTEVELVDVGPDIRDSLIVVLNAGPYEPAAGCVRAMAPGGEVILFASDPPLDARWQAVGVEPGEYALEVDDPRFEPLDSVRVHTGRPLKLNLRGSSAIALEVCGKRELVELRNYGLVGRYRRANDKADDFTLAADGSVAPPNGVFRGIFPGDLELELRVAGRPTQRVSVDALQPGETRTVEVTVGEFVALRGRVFDAEGKSAAGIAVQLTRGELPGHDLGPDASGSFALSNGASVEVPYRDDETQTDEEGHFVFPDLAEGMYALRASASPWARVDARVDLTPGTGEVTMRLPELGALELTFVRSPEADLEHVAIRVLRAPSDLSTRIDSWLATESTIPVHATLGLWPVAVGEVELELTETIGGGTSLFHLATLRVRPGKTTRHVFDLRGLARSAGELDTDAEVELVEFLPLADDATEPTGTVAATAHPEVGHASIHLPAGRYLVRASNAANGWTFDAPRVLEVRQDERFELELDVPLVERMLRVVDEDGAPLAGLELTWWSASAEPGRARAVSDEVGLVQLALPALRYSLAPAGTSERVTSFDWIAGVGPLDVALRTGD